MVSSPNGADAIKYYNAETCKVLTSHNFHNIIPPEVPTPPEDIDLTPDSLSEGEPAGSTPPHLGITVSDDVTWNLEPNRKHKQNETEGGNDINEPWRMHGVHISYKILQNPFPDEEDENNSLTMEEVYAIIAGEELTNLKETKNCLNGELPYKMS